MIRSIVAVLLCSWATMGYSATLECQGTRYERALCLYGSSEWKGAERELSTLVEADAPGRETLKAMYFLARTKMKTGEWDEASELWIRLFSLSPAFYREWNGDYLLGECRRRSGRD